MERVRIGFAEKLGFGLFSISSNIVSSFVSTFILFFYTNVLGLMPAMGGLIISLGVVWDAINDPLIASYADNHFFKSGERVRPYALYIPIPLAITAVLMFTSFGLDVTASTIIAIIAYFIFVTLTTVLRLPSYAMPQLATGNTEQRLTLNTFVSGGATIGAVLASVLCWPLVRVFAGVDGDGNMINSEKGFIFGAAVVGLIVIFGSFFQYFTTRERVRPKHTGEKVSIIASFKLLLKNSDFCWNSAFSTLYFINNTLVTANLVYYCTYVLKQPGMVSLIMGLFAVGSVLILPLVSVIHKKCGRKISMMIGGGLVLLSKIPFMLMPDSLIGMLPCVFLMGLSVAMNIVMFSTTRADISDLVEYENGKRIDSMVINLMGFLNKCGESLTALAIGLVLQFAGYSSALASQPTSAINAITGLMGWVGAVIAVLMIVCASRIKVDERVAAMRSGESNA